MDQIIMIEGNVAAEARNNSLVKGCTAADLDWLVHCKRLEACISANMAHFEYKM